MKREVIVLKEVRCKRCNGLLFEAENASLIIKCRKCKYVNKVKI